MRPLLALLVLAVPAVAADVLPYKSDSAYYRARFPAPPEPDGKELTVGAERTVPVWTNKANEPHSNAVFAVVVAEYPPAFADVPAQTILDGARDGLKGKDGKVKADDAVKGPHPGRQVRIEAGRNTIRARLFVVGSRLYQVTVTGQTKTFPDKLSDEFFASFEPTPR